MEPKILTDSDKLQEMYELYGMAAHYCCNIEYRFAELLLHPEWQRQAVSNPEEIEAVYADLSRMTLRQLMKKYREHYNFTDEQEAVIDEVQTKRNYLTHRFFGMYGKRMDNPDVVEEMIAELKDLMAYFQEVSYSLAIE